MSLQHWDTDNISEITQLTGAETRTTETQSSEVVGGIALEPNGLNLRLPPKAARKKICMFDRLFMTVQHPNCFRMRWNRRNQMRIVVE